MPNFKDHLVNEKFSNIFYELSMRKSIKGKSDLAKKLDTYNHVINNILKGERNITVDQILKLCEYFNVSADYVFGLSDRMFLNESILPNYEAEDSRWGKEGNIHLIPIKAAAGYQIDLNALSREEDIPRFSLPGMTGNLFAFEIEGDSMMPTITNGDLVVCEKMETSESIKDNHVYVIISDVIVAKRIHQIKNKNGQLHALELISDNGSLYQPYTIELEEIRQILKVKCRMTSHGLI